MSQPHDAHVCSQIHCIPSYFCVVWGLVTTVLVRPCDRDTHCNVLACSLPLCVRVTLNVILHHEQRLMPDAFHHRVPSAACVVSSTPPAPIRSTSDAINIYLGRCRGPVKAAASAQATWSLDAAALLAGHRLVCQV